MRRTVIIVFITALLLGPGTALAGFTLGNQQEFTFGVAKQSGVSPESVPSIVGNLAAGLFSAVGLFFFIMVFYGGFRWITARGNEEQVAKAQKTVSAAFIGLIIVLASYSITVFLDRLTAPEPTNVGDARYQCFITLQDGRIDSAVINAVPGTEIQACQDYCSVVLFSSPSCVGATIQATRQP